MGKRIGVIGLGYVGLPLAVAFAKKHEVTAYDIDPGRIKALQDGLDSTQECSTEQLKQSTVDFSTDPGRLAACQIFIVTVPTPVDRNKKPDLRILLAATHTVGSYLKPGDLVIFESTVYPGCTEEDCVPVLEKASGLVFNRDFFAGYSPERINPGDKVHRLHTIKKVVSGSTPAAADAVQELYNSIIDAGTFRASSIRVAEAAKVIENAQRDLNISFVNELALIFDRMGLDTTEVLEAASTKWNFLPFKPGLVGGHCIGVDPYYLTHKAESLGYLPQVILSGRRINENMGIFVAGKVVKLMIRKGQRVEGARALILGFTFKENCGDIRNSRVIDIYRELLEFGMHIDVFDPHVKSAAAESEYGIRLIPRLEHVYDAIILAVAHEEFRNLDVRAHTGPLSVVFDTKSFLDRELVDARL